MFLVSINSHSFNMFLNEATCFFSTFLSTLDFHFHFSEAADVYFVWFLLLFSAVAREKSLKVCKHKLCKTLNQDEVIFLWCFISTPKLPQRRKGDHRAGFVCSLVEHFEVNLFKCKTLLWIKANKAQESRGGEHTESLNPQTLFKWESCPWTWTSLEMNTTVLPHWLNTTKLNLCT